MRIATIADVKPQLFTPFPSKGVETNKKDMELKAKLVYDSGSQRFYKLSHKITKGYRFGKEVDLLQDMANERKIAKEQYRHLFPLNGVDIICVSDAHTHFERLVFVGIKTDDGKYGRANSQIDGTHTFMIHGGDESRMKHDYVYLRRLARLNGYSFTNPELSPVQSETEVSEG